MRSDWDDAPEYLRNRKQQSPWRFLAILAIGSVIITALAFTFDKPIVLDVDQIKQGIHVGRKPWFNQAPAQPSQPVIQHSIASYEAPATEPASQQRQLSQEEIEWFEDATARAVESRQTSFNDGNYSLKQPANTYIPPRAVHQTVASPTASERRSRTVNREHTAKWIKSWNGGTDYLAEWMAVDNHIDGTSVCANHRRGSIDYRECRKSGQAAFPSGVPDMARALMVIAKLIASR